MANKLNLLSGNIRGLNSRLKRSLVFNYLRRYKPHIILLQETHLQGSRVLALKQANIMKVIHAEYSTYSRGVAILVIKKANAHILHIANAHILHFKTDVKGRFVKYKNIQCMLDLGVCLYSTSIFFLGIGGGIVGSSEDSTGTNAVSRRFYCSVGCDSG